MAMTPQKKAPGRKNQTIIQSPIVKRVLSTPVTLQGWLQKRGGDGLMLWKKRWFVLSDYCLFYYKDTDEEKILGSFILPSYKISPCSNEDKVYKKYSFKAEHNNMRTYYFAADNDVLMAQWVKALTLASLLQEPGPVVKTTNNQNVANKPNSEGQNYGDYQYSTSEGGVGTNSNSSDNQPLYANAPPKPKRLNEGPSPDCSPELQEEREPQNSYTQDWTYPYYKTPHIPPISAFNVQHYEKTTPESYSRNLYQQGNLQQSNEIHLRNNIQQSNALGHYQHLQYFSSNPKIPNNHPPRPHSCDFLDYEVRQQPQEPSTQSYSKVITLPRRPKSSLSVLGPKDETFDSLDWSEESYAKKMRQSAMYVRSQVDTPTGLTRMPPNKRRINFDTSNVERSGDELQPEFLPQEILMRDPRSNDPLFKRSASARLPEPEQQYLTVKMNGMDTSDNSDGRKTQQREESMKRLLEWKQRMLQSPLSQKAPQRQPELQKHKDININPETLTKTSNIGNNDLLNTNVFHSKGVNLSPTKEFRVEKFNSRVDSGFSDSGTIKREFMAFYKDQSSAQCNVSKMDAKSNLQQDEDYSNENLTRKSESDSIEKPSVYQSAAHIYGSDKRSGSSTNSSFDNTKPIYSNSSIEGRANSSTSEFSKEKVMKTPSSSGSAEEKRSEVDEEWGLKLDESRVIKEFSYHYIKCDNHEGFKETDSFHTNFKNRHLQSLKQEEGKKRALFASQIQTFEVKKTKLEDLSPKPVPAGILKTSKIKKEHIKFEESSLRSDWQESLKRKVLSDSEILNYEVTSDLDEKRTSMCPLKQGGSSSDDDRDEEVAAVLSQNPRHTPIQSEFSTPLKHTLSVCSTDSGTVIEKRTSFGTPLSLPDSTSTLTEENYMPMTPRKRPMSATPTKESDQSNLLTSPHRISLEHILDAVEECPYVEMTQNGKDKSKLQMKLISSSSKSTDFDLESSTYIDLDPGKNLNYEMHVYNEMNTQEPLYMEVKDKNLSDSNFSHEISNVGYLGMNKNEEEQNISTRTSLPDILSTSAQTFNHSSGRSDSSDADDEASKDLDSIDAPRHPRFSLSDTFRPASYYLGNSLSERTIIAMNSDHPDSSDSDLVSPPPIPASSPPLDDLDTSIDSTINNKEISPAVSKEDFDTNFSKCNFSSCKKNDLQLPLDLGSSEEESVKSDKTDLFLKRRPLSADILSNFHEFGMLDMPSPRDNKSSSDVESVENGKVKSPYHQENEFYEQQDLKLQKLMESRPYNYLLQQKDEYGFTTGPNKVFRDTKRDQCLEAANMKTSDYTMKINGNKPILNPHIYKNNQYNGYSHESSGISESYSQKTPKNPDVNEYMNSQISGLSQDQQNSAPYYYSDLLKVDQRNGMYGKNSKTKPELLPRDNLYPPDVYNRENFKPNQRDTQLVRTAESNMLAPPPLLERKSNIRPHTIYRRSDLSNETLRNQAEQKDLTSQDERSLEHNRSRSLEGLMESKNVTSYRRVPPENQQGYITPQIPMAQVSKFSTLRAAPAQPPKQSDVWDEDALWRENMRKTSVRHTRSLEDLDKKVEAIPSSPAPQTKPPEAVYVNSNFTRQEINDINQRSTIDKDREKIRQWDLLSSAPATLSTSHIVNASVSDSKNFSNQKAAYAAVNDSNYGQTGVKCETKPKASPQTSTNRTAESKQRGNWNLKLSAGELLGRTHEELVLLLIQLRRQRASVCKSMERCHREIEAQACLTDYDAANRFEHLQRLEELKARLLELEKQYEKGKPLVNLVDNMVKLGSLYQAGTQSVPSQRLEFNHKVQEQRILADERRDWERIRPDHHDLQAKVEQLYRLDKLLQEESGTLHSLQEDKGILERALGGLRNKLQGVHGNTAETEWYRRQQRLLERELSRIRSILALNSKKLEETVAENARLEQELVVIRQKLQISRRTTEPGGATTAALESELCRVQMLVGNLLRQRQELSLQVRQLTEKSHSLSQQIWPSPNSGLASRKKQNTSGWIETDLDVDTNDVNKEVSHDLREPPSYVSPLYVNTESVNKRLQHIPEVNSYHEECLEDMSPLTARSPEFYRQFETDDDSSKRPFNSAWKEKPQEIKTVRIVKRESERRQRDRDRSGNLGIPLTSSAKRVIPEEDICFTTVEKPLSERTMEESFHSESIESQPPPPGPRSDSVNAVWNLVRKNKLKGSIVGGVTPLEKDELNLSSDSPQLSPVYLSEAARKIVEEVAWQGKGEKRLIPKEKRRHHTVSGPSIIAPKSVYSQRGSRDDLDMERVLRPRLTTPDVVRSTLNRSDPHFTKETIDNILGAPGKIIIPERYIPETQPQLSEEEIQKRSKKADAIRKMLCETATVAPKDPEIKEKSMSLKHKVEEEKRNREHLLQLSQILAQEVMEKSKIVAGVNSTMSPE